MTLSSRGAPLMGVASVKDAMTERIRMGAFFDIVRINVQTT